MTTVCDLGSVIDEKTPLRCNKVIKSGETAFHIINTKKKNRQTEKERARWRQTNDRPTFLQTHTHHLLSPISISLCLPTK